MKALEIEQQVMQEAKSAKQQAELSREIQEETDSRAREVVFLVPFLFGSLSFCSCSCSCSLSSHALAQALVAEARQKLNELSVAERKVQEEYINLKAVLKVSGGA